MPAILRVCGQADDPDTAITRLLFVIESIGRRSAYLALLGENPLALKQLVRLVGASSEISHWIGKHPVILDELLDPIAGFRLQDHHAIEVELRRKLDRCDQSDLEVIMDQLREYRQGYSLRVAAADIAQLIDIDVVSKSLSALAQALLCQALTHAVSTLDRISAPRRFQTLALLPTANWAAWNWATTLIWISYLSTINRVMKTQPELEKDVIILAGWPGDWRIFSPLAPPRAKSTPLIRD
jgi:glutamine synthetase adenylyltransferase